MVRLSMRFAFLFILSLILGANPALAHFGIIKPGKSMIMEAGEARIPLDVAFAHPFAQNGMNMKKPKAFYVLHDGKRTDLLPSLKAVKYLNADAWQGEYTVTRPGVYQFALEPEPYFEKAEDSFIIHYVKTVIGAFGQDDGWDVALGLPMEIVPLTRPFANYTGNSFTGQVLKHGRPLANAVVEVECLNAQGRHRAPNDYFETQTLHTDANGYFTFTVPWAGWWGFAALSDGDKTTLDGKTGDTELGGVLWLEFVQPEIAGRSK